MDSRSEGRLCSCAWEERDLLQASSRLTAPISYGVLHIAPILPEFLAQYPEVAIDLHLSDNYVDLVGEGYDAAIRISSLPDSSLVTRILAPVFRHLVAAPRYLSKYGRPSHPLRLSEHRCIAYISTPGETWHFTDAAGTAESVTVKGPLTATNGEALAGALEAGIGIADPVVTPTASGKTLLGRFVIEHRRGHLLQVVGARNAECSATDSLDTRKQ